jgi:hypothetical protein
MLAISTQGHGFLYALFLELFGAGLEELLKGHDNVYHVEELDALQVSTSIYRIEVEWYIRLMVAISFLELSHHHDDGACVLDKHLLNGIHDLCAWTFETLSKKDSNFSIYKEYVTAAHLGIRSILHTSSAVKIIKQWRKERSLDDIEYINTKGIRTMPRHTRPLSHEVKDYLVDLLISKKIAHKTIQPKKGDEFECFRSRYGLYITKNINEQEGKYNNKSLYCHLYDIPWQSAIIRSMDFIPIPSNTLNNDHDTSSIDKRSWNKHIHHRGGVGRELYQIALDFYLYDEESAYNRLLDASRVIDHYLLRNEKSFTKNQHNNNLKSKLEIWRGKPGKKLYSNIQKLIYLDIHRLIKQNGDNDTSYKIWCDLANKYPAILLLLSNFGPVPDLNKAKDTPNISGSEDSSTYNYDLTVRDKPKYVRRLNKLHGLKLEQLLAILLDHAASTSNSNHFLEPLILYLSTRSNNNNLNYFLGQGKQANDNTQNKTWYLDQNNNKNHFDLLIRSLNRSRNSNLPDKESAKKTYLLSRMTTRNAESGTNTFLNKMLYEDIKFSEGYEDTSSNTLLLGEYDFLSLKPISGICRCGLPKTYKPGNPPKKKSTPILQCFFLRREYTLPVRLWNRNCGTSRIEPLDWNEIEKNPIVAILSIQLTRRTTRLDFIIRLLRTLEYISEKSYLGNKNYRELEGFGAYDHLLISDGWGDLLVVFRSKDKDLHSSRLDEIYNLQRYFYNDFQVDKTELSLTPCCLDWATTQLDREKNNNAYRISCNLRLKENRFISPSLKDLKDKIISNSGHPDVNFACLDKTGEIDKDKSHPCFTLSQTSSKADYTIRFSHAFRIEKEKKNALMMGRIVKLLEGTNLDRLETVVERIVRIHTTSEE